MQIAVHQNLTGWFVTAAALLPCHLLGRTGLGEETPVLPETQLGDITMEGGPPMGVHFMRNMQL
jgi:hypothetical protein